MTKIFPGQLWVRKAPNVNRPGYVFMIMVIEPMAIENIPLITATRDAYDEAGWPRRIVWWNTVGYVRGKKSVRLEHSERDILTGFDLVGRASCPGVVTGSTGG